MFQHADKANSWAMDIYRKCSTEYDNLHRDIANECVFLLMLLMRMLIKTIRCKKRLHNHGHETQDIDYVHYSLAHTLRQALVYRLNPRGQLCGLSRQRIGGG